MHSGVDRRAKMGRCSSSTPCSPAGRRPADRRLTGAPRRAPVPVGGTDRRRDGRPGAAVLDLRAKPPGGSRRLICRTSAVLATVCGLPSPAGGSPESRSWPTAGTCRSARAPLPPSKGCPARLSKSRLVDGVVLGPLTDVLAMPAWLPLANVFSVGDLLIGIGCAAAFAASMHGRGPTVSRRPVRRGTDPTVRLERHLRRMVPGPMAPSVESRAKSAQRWPRTRVV